jgi:site-specific recombinase XerD
MFIIKCHTRIHRDEERLFIDAPREKALNLKLKLLPGIRWSKTYKQWHVPLSEDNYRLLCKTMSGLAIIESASLEDIFKGTSPQIAVVNARSQSLTSSPRVAIQFKNQVANSSLRIAGINGHVMQLFKRELVLKAYSASTIRTYCNEMMQFLAAIKNTLADDFDSDRIKNYLLYCFEKLQLSENTVHSRMNALKFYYEQVLKKEKFFWEIPRPKKQLQLPRFFNQDEVAAIINSTPNVKHKAMLMLCYSTGSRVSEVVSLKTTNVDSKRMAILIQQAKGKKDRIVPLSPVLLVMLREYAINYKPSGKGFLFQGSSEGSPYSGRSLQEILHLAKEKAKVFKPGGVHALRHSFATHLLDKGTDISMIQKLLGHNDIKTTLRYLHTTNKDILGIISPLDSLELKM